LVTAAIGVFAVHLVRERGSVKIIDKLTIMFNEKLLVGGTWRIDCSGEVQRTFRDPFGIDIPRTLNSVVIA
jgi:cell wall-associated NlpC family hydrolase